MFQKAVKTQSRLRLAIFGPSGSGKTFTSLRIAKGMGGKVAVIDTERGSASKYADRFEFDTCQLKQPRIESYVEVIQGAGQAGYHVLIIDSLSHGWQELLAEVDRLARSKYKGNTWSAWSEGTPLQRQLVDAILDFPGHVIATMRSKTEWTTEKDERSGKSKPVRVGLAPEQGKGIEYEFDLLLEMSVDHIGQVLKDRTGRFQDALLEKPDEEFGQSLVRWLMDPALLEDHCPDPHTVPSAKEREPSKAPISEQSSSPNAHDVGGLAEVPPELPQQTPEDEIITKIRMELSSHNIPPNCWEGWIRKASEPVGGFGSDDIKARRVSKSRLGACLGTLRRMLREAEGQHDAMAQAQELM